MLIRLGILSIIYLSLIFGRARWGGSGALYLQPATAGLNSCSRLYFCRVCLIQVAMIIGSCATKACELRQVRKGATVSSTLRVPRGCLIRANYMGYVCRSKSKTGARPIKFIYMGTFLEVFLPGVSLYNIM